jgi:hypothetical protein
MLAEYRLCNYVYWLNKNILDPEIFEVTKISVHNEITIHGVMSGKYLDDIGIVAIPLTALWLENLGFNREDGKWKKALDSSVIAFLKANKGKDKEYEMHICSLQHSVSIDSLHFVHQLQNLYFGLTRKQLRLPSE